MSHADPELDASIVDGTVQRTPTVLVLDTSGSMNEETNSADGEPVSKIDQLNRGLELFEQEVTREASTSERVDVGVVAFGGEARVVGEFTNVTDWTPPTLEAGGSTPMGAAIETAIDTVEHVKRTYHENGTPYTRPLVWLLTDGQPTDMDVDDARWSAVTDQIAQGERNDHLMFLPMGVSGADMATLSALVEGIDRPALELEEGAFAEYFEFVSNSIATVSAAEGTPDRVGDTDDLSRFVQE